LVPIVTTTFMYLPVISGSGFVCNPVLIPVVVKQDEISKNAESQTSYAKHR